MARKWQKWSHSCQCPYMWGNKRLFASSKLFHFPEMNSTEDFWGLRWVFRSLKGLPATKLAKIGRKRQKSPTELSFLSYRRIQQLLHGPSTTLFSLNDLNWDWRVWILSTWVYILPFHTKIVPCILILQIVFIVIMPELHTQYPPAVCCILQ